MKIIGRGSLSNHILKNIFRYLSRPWREFNMSLDDCTNIHACSFGKNGWHHLVETFKQIDNNPTIPSNETILYKYHNKFHPKSTFDILPQGTTKFYPPYWVYPWGSFFSNRDTVPRRGTLETRFCGPSDISLIADEFNRMVTIYNKLKEEGYRPWAYGNKPITGIIIEDEKKNTKMVILGGNHRLAALATLGHTHVPIRLDDRSDRPFLREKNVRKWHFVKTGECSIEDALKIFRVYFTENGHHIKKLIGS